MGGYTGQLPIPNTFPQSHEQREFSHVFLASRADGELPSGRFTEGPTLDGQGEFSVALNRPPGEETMLAPPVEAAYTQQEQQQGTTERRKRRVSGS